MAILDNNFSAKAILFWLPFLFLLNACQRNSHEDQQKISDMLRLVSELSEVIAERNRESTENTLCSIPKIQIHVGANAITIINPNCYNGAARDSVVQSGVRRLNSLGVTESRRWLFDIVRKLDTIFMVKEVVSIDTTPFENRRAYVKCTDRKYLLISENDPGNITRLYDDCRSIHNGWLVCSK